MRLVTEVAAVISVGSAGRLSTRINNSLISSASLGNCLTNCPIEFDSSEIADPKVGPLTSAMIEPSRNSLERSHSQALSRGGRPRLVKKPSFKPDSASDNDAALAPGFIPGSLDTEPVTW